MEKVSHKFKSTCIYTRTRKVLNEWFSLTSRQQTAGRGRKLSQNKSRNNSESELTDIHRTQAIWLSGHFILAGFNHKPSALAASLL